MKYRKKPVVIGAVQWDGNLSTVEVLLAGTAEECTPVALSQDSGDPRLLIQTLEGIMTAHVGDWIIRGVKGELYPCRDDIFRATYEAVT